MARFLEHRVADRVDPPFFSDIVAIMEDRRQNPNQVLIVSLEEDDDQDIKKFWHIYDVVSTVMNKAKVVRIQHRLQQTLYLLFTDDFPTSALPTIYVFGPNSLTPTYTYSGHIPHPMEFIAHFNQLNAPIISYGPLANAVPELKPFDPFADMSNNDVRNRNTAPATPSVESPAPKPEPQQEKVAKPAPKPRYIEEDDEVETDPFLAAAAKPKPKPKPKPVQSQPVQPPKPKIVVTVLTPDGNEAVQEFSVTQPMLMVHKWVQKLLVQGGNYKLKIIPSGEELPNNPLENLQQYAPALKLKLEVERKLIPEFNFGIFRKLKDILSDYTPFADKADDPYDFWKTQPQQVQRARPRYM